MFTDIHKLHEFIAKDAFHNSQERSEEANLQSVNDIAREWTTRLRNMPIPSSGSPSDSLFDALVVEDVIKDIFIWLHDPSTNCLAMWVHDDDRAWTSLIGQAVAEILAKREELAATYFFPRQKDLVNSGTATPYPSFVVPTIAYQLARNIPAVKAQIADILAHEISIFNLKVHEQVAKLVIEPLKRASELLELPITSASVIIVHALEDCDKVDFQTVFLEAFLHGLASIEALPFSQRLLILGRSTENLRECFSRLSGRILHRPAHIQRWCAREQDIYRREEEVMKAEADLSRKMEDVRRKAESLQKAWKIQARAKQIEEEFRHREERFLQQEDELRRRREELVQKEKEIERKSAELRNQQEVLEQSNGGILQQEDELRRRQEELVQREKEIERKAEEDYSRKMEYVRQEAESLQNVHQARPKQLEEEFRQREERFLQQDGELRRRREELVQREKKIEGKTTDIPTQEKVIEQSNGGNGTVQVNDGIHNVILFGESGSGKSSLVNMIVGEPVAKTSDAVGVCTLQNEVYNSNFHNTAFRIHDTAGLNEGEQGRVPHWKSIHNLYTLIRQLDSISLLVYCMRGRIKENAMANWTLFNTVICGEKVPIITVVTGLEEEGDYPDDWWLREENKNLFRMYQMNPKAVVCVASIRGKWNEYADIYIKSQDKLRRVIKDECLQRPWEEEKDEWFANAYENVYTSGFVARIRLEFSTIMRIAVDQFFKETGMKEDDREKLESTLLEAEKKWRKSNRSRIPPKRG